MSESIFEIPIQTNSGETKTLADFKGKVLLVVNTASACGFTPQYKGLQEIYELYKDKGFEVLAFPCNQFGEQEPGSDTEIKQFCELKYKTTFPLFAKIDVNGKDTHPLYGVLKKSAKGILGTEDIKWNFTKFLVDRNGKVVDRFASTTKPEDLKKNIEKLL